MARAAGHFQRPAGAAPIVALTHLLRLRTESWRQVYLLNVKDS